MYLQNSFHCILIFENPIDSINLLLKNLTRIITRVLLIVSFYCKMQVLNKSQRPLKLVSVSEENRTEAHVPVCV